MTGSQNSLTETAILAVSVGLTWLLPHQDSNRLGRT